METEQPWLIAKAMDILWKLYLIVAEDRRDGGGGGGGRDAMVLFSVSLHLLLLMNDIMR